MSERIRRIPFENIAGALDFPAIFKERLETLPTLPEDFPSDYIVLGIQSVKRFIPANMHRSKADGEPRYILWIPAGHDRMSGYGFVHFKVEETLRRFFGSERIDTQIGGSLSTYVVQDQEDRLFLAAESHTSTDYVLGDARIDEFREMWEILAREYEIQSVVSKVEEVIDGKTQIITDVLVDFVGFHRQMNHIVEIAQRHAMTQSQFLRFKSLTSAHSQSGSRVDYETIAREIVEEE